MPKLYARYGTVTSAKTLNLLAIADTYERQGKKAFIIKPKIDTRFGEKSVKSRVGTVRDADLVVSCLLDLENLLKDPILNELDCLLVDEAQFLTPEMIDVLRVLTNNVPVICFFIRTDWKLNMFPAVIRIFEVCDEITEIKTTCKLCNKKAWNNFKVNKSNKDAIQISGQTEELYIPLCFSHFMSMSADEE